MKSLINSAVLEAIIEIGDTTNERKSLRETLLLVVVKYEPNSSFISSIVVEVIRVVRIASKLNFSFIFLFIFSFRAIDCVLYIFHSVHTKVFGGFNKLSIQSRVEKKCRNITGVGKRPKI